MCAICVSTHLIAGSSCNAAVFSVNSILKANYMENYNLLFVVAACTHANFGVDRRGILVTSCGISLFPGVFQYARW